MTFVAPSIAVAAKTALPLNVVVPELCIVKSSAELLINDVDFYPRRS